jgi:hypothetical protein
MDSEARDLVEAFRVDADRDVESIVVLLIEDDKLEVGAMRVLASWPQLRHRWARPRRARPDDGQPTPDAWHWLVSGLDIDYDELAKAAGVSRAIARARIHVLLANKLALPDGSVSKPARAALQQHARRALGVRAKKQDGAKAKPDDGAN